MTAYFRIHKSKIIGISRFPYDEATDYKTIELELTPEDFSIAADIYKYESGILVRLPMPKYDEEGNRL